jgi:O-antigen/teichoic acid export membrane protein
MVGSNPAGHESERTRGSFFVSAVLTYGTNLTVAVLSLVNVLVVSRVLGPSGRGSVAFLTAIAYLTSNLSTFGVQEANANIAAAEPGARRSLATNSLLLALVFGVATIVFLTALIAVFPGVAGDSTAGLRQLTFASLPILILGIYMRFLVQADYGFAVTNAAWLITPIANVLLNGALAVFGLLSVGTAVATWIGGQVLATVMLVSYVSRHLAGFGRPDFGLMRRSLGFGLRSHAGRVMLLGNYRLDQWLLGAISGSRELGLYSVAVAWAEALWYLPTTLAAVQRPDLVRAARDRAAYQAALVFRTVALMTGVAALILIVLAPFFCVTIFGEDFRGSVDDLRILALGAVGVTALKLLGNALTAQQRPGLASTAIGAGFVATIVLDIILIPPFGGAGAASASTIAYLAGGIAIGVLFTRAVGGRFVDLLPRTADLKWLWRNARHVASGASRRLAERRSHPAGQHPEPVPDVERPEGADDSRQETP